VLYNSTTIACSLLGCHCTLARVWSQVEDASFFVGCGTAHHNIRSCSQKQYQ